VDGKRKKVTESRHRCEKGVLCGISGGKEIGLWFRKEGIFTQTVARRNHYRHRDGKNSLIFEEPMSSEFRKYVFV